MESIIAIGVLAAIAGIIGYTVWIASNSFRPQLTAEEETWQRLARSHQLHFVPSTNMADTFVTGTYQGHSLTLRTIEHETTGQLQTRISLSRQQAGAGPVDPQVLNDLARLSVSSPLKGRLGAEANGGTIFYEQFGVETDITHLERMFKLLADLLTIYPQVVELGEKPSPPYRKLAR